MTARGLRLNNPGNVRKGIAWQGMADVQADPDFITFKSPEYGIRAMAKIMMTYKNKYSICTLNTFTPRWAPTQENDTRAYINSLVQHTGFKEDEKIDLTDAHVLMRLIPAVILHENGSQPYDSGTIALGITKAILK